VCSEEREQSRVLTMSAFKIGGFYFLLKIRINLQLKKHLNSIHRCMQYLSMFSCYLTQLLIIKHDLNLFTDN